MHPFNTLFAFPFELGFGLAAFLRVYSHDTVGYLTRLFISAKLPLLCSLLQQQKGKNELSFEPWHTRTHTHWRSRRGHPVPSLSHVPPSLSQCGDPLAPLRPSVCSFVLWCALPSRLRRRRLLCPLLRSNSGSREGGRERRDGGRHRRRPREFSFPNLATVPKVKAGNFSPAAKRGRKEGRDDGGGRRAATFKSACPDI